MAKSLGKLLILLHVCICRADRAQVLVTGSDGHLQRIRPIITKIDWGTPADQRRQEILQNADAKAAQVMKEQQTQICGGTQIREIIAKPSGASSVRTMNWDKVMKIAEDYIQEEGHKIAALTKEVENLESTLKKQQEMEKFTPISKDSIISLITPAVNSGYGELIHAQQSLCSAKPQRSVDETGKRIRIGTLRQQQSSVEAFTTEVETNFKAKGVRSDASLFHSVCMELLSTERIDGVNSNCDEFCLALGAIVQRASDATAGSSGETAAEQISQQLERKANDLHLAVMRQSECERTKQNLEAFQQELTTLAGAIDKNWDSVLAIQDEFDEAGMAFEDMEDELKSQQETTKELQAIFAQNEQTMLAAKAAFDEVEEKKAALHTQLDRTMEQVSIAQKALNKASAAGRAVSAVKTAVSDTMLKMVTYFDEAVRAPVSNIGLGLDTAIGDYFDMDSLSSKDSAKDVANSVKGLGEFCKDTAMPSFVAVKEHVDLSPMCALGGTTEAIVTRIDDAVEDKADLVLRNLKTAQSYLNPYKGMKDMDLKKAQELVEKGEPTGLQEVKSVLQKASFWQYLKKWEVDGPLLPLYKQLGNALQELTSAKEQADAAVQATMANLQTIVTKSMEVKEVLKAAIAAEATSKEAKQDAEKALASLEQDCADQARLLSKMKEASEKAMASYENAKANLESAHSQGLATA